MRSASSSSRGALGQEVVLEAVSQPACGAPRSQPAASGPPNGKRRRLPPLVVAPVLVPASFVVGPDPMALVFNGYELGAPLFAG